MVIAVSTSPCRRMSGLAVCCFWHDNAKLVPLLQCRYHLSRGPSATIYTWLFALFFSSLLLHPYKKLMYTASYSCHLPLLCQILLCMISKVLLCLVVLWYDAHVFMPVAFSYSLCTDKATTFKIPVDELVRAVFLGRSCLLPKFLIKLSSSTTKL